MIQKKLFQDERDANAWGFINEVASEYNLVEASSRNLSVLTRGITNGSTSSQVIAKVITDDKLMQLIVNDKLAAFVILRRDDANWTEATYVINEAVIEEVKSAKKQ